MTWHWTKNAPGDQPVIILFVSRGHLFSFTSPVLSISICLWMGTGLTIWICFSFSLLWSISSFSPFNLHTSLWDFLRYYIVMFNNETIKISTFHTWKLLISWVGIWFNKLKYISNAHPTAKIAWKYIVTIFTYLLKLFWDFLLLTIGLINQPIFRNSVCQVSN